MSKHSNITEFEEDSPVYCYLDETGFPWFSAADVSRVLNTQNVPAREFITLFDILAMAAEINVSKDDAKPTIRLAKAIALMYPAIFSDSIWSLIDAIEVAKVWYWMPLGGKKNSQPVCTYLIADKRNGLIKIGKSKTPGHREKTLQSEVPEVSMLAYIEQDIESELHKRFKAQRVRGEWFSLTDAQVQSLLTEYPFHQFRAARKK